MKNFNTLKRWPNIHACPLDLECWHDWWRYGMPMRVHRKERMWTIPGPLLWISNHRSQVVWDWSNPVKLTPRRPNPTSATAEEQPSSANPVSREV